jgi:hypothetical protein
MKIVFPNIFPAMPSYKPKERLQENYRAVKYLQLILFTYQMKSKL